MCLVCFFFASKVDIAFIMNDPLPGEQEMYNLYLNLVAKPFLE